MAWIESHEEIWDHHKVHRLCTAIKQPDYAVVGRLISLWHFVLRNAWRDANLEPWGDDGIERASRWDGEKGVFVNALRNCGFLDDFVIHGWEKRAGGLIRDRRRKEVQRRSRKRPGLKADGRRTKVGQEVATVPYRTVPDSTISNHIETKELSAVAAASPDHVKFVEGFKAVYQEVTGQPFKVDKHHWVIAASLVKAHGFESCVSKARLLGSLCRNRSAWFSKDGFGSFTLETLSSKWNNIIPGSAQTKDDELREELKKQEANRVRADNLVK